MSDLKQQLEKAKTSYDAARAALETARRIYQDGRGKEYAEVKQNVLTLKARIDEQKHASQAAKDSLAQALRSSNGAITPQAKEALAHRRNADDLLDQYRELMVESQRTSIDVHIAASEAAAAYVKTYDTASQCWAEMNVFAALVECGERIARAMAVMPQLETLTPYAVKNTSLRGIVCRELMIAELDKLRKQYDDEVRPYVDEIGNLDLGSMAMNEILTPGEAKIARAQKENHQVCTRVA
jgi:hypothetical protein